MKHLSPQRRNLFGRVRTWTFYAQHPWRWRLSVLMFFFALFLVISTPAVFGVVQEGSGLQRSAAQSRAAIGRQDLRAAREQTDTAYSQARRGRFYSFLLTGWRFMPYVGTQVQAIEVTYRVAVELTAAVRDGLAVAEDVLGPLKKSDASFQFGTLTAEEKRGLMERLSRASNQLESTRQHAREAVEIYNAFPRSNVHPRILETIAPLTAQLPLIEQAMNDIVPSTQIIPHLAGFPEEQTFLFLMQNNTELRPTGGFIGTYGVVKTANGGISSFTTSDVYDLDRRSRNTLFVTPPRPLTKYNDTDQWFFRDANWSPDFPTAAERLLEFYRLENGPEKNFNGVVAVTPTFIQSLLAVSGNITVDGITFTPENLTERLQPLSERKELIGEMSKILMSRIMNLPQKRWQEFFLAVTTAIKEKHLLLYSRDPEMQKKLINLRWAGNVPANVVDSVLVIDASLGSLKSDYLVDRTIRYALTVKNQESVAAVSIQYQHSGQFSAQTTRYRTYVRVYVPSGAILRSSSGAMDHDQLHGGRPGAVETLSEIDRTVFGAFISIEPGETRTLTMEYVLPATVAVAIQKGVYRLDFYKQPGTIAHALDLSLTFPKNVKFVDGIDGSAIEQRHTMVAKTNLQTDRQINVTF